MEKQIIDTLNSNKTFGIMERFKYTIYELDENENYIHRIIFIANYGNDNIEYFHTIFIIENNLKDIIKNEISQFPEVFYLVLNNKFPPGIITDKKINTLEEANLYIWYLPIKNLICYLEKQKYEMKKKLIQNIFPDENGFFEI